MAKKRKLTDAQLKLRKKEYDRKRREKMKSDPINLERLREKERLKYAKKKEKGQVKPVSEMSSREKRLKRKIWKKNSQTYRDKKGVLCKSLATVLDITPPPSPGPSFENIHQNREEQQRSLVTTKRKIQLRRRRATLYSKISKLQKALKDEKKKGEKFRKRYQRLAKKFQTSPEVKVSELLQNVKVPITVVKKKLVFSEVITRQLTNYYEDQNKHSDKRNFLEVMNRRSKIQTQSESDSKRCSKDIPDENAKGTCPDYNIGDYVIIKWDDETYPGQITSVFEEGTLVKCMTRGSIAWKWPTLTDEQLYNWNDVLQKIQPPTLIKRGCYFVREMDKAD